MFCTRCVAQSCCTGRTAGPRTGVQVVYSVTAWLLVLEVASSADISLLLRRGAEQNHVTALYNLATCYEAGRGTVILTICAVLSKLVELITDHRSH